MQELNRVTLDRLAKGKKAVVSQIVCSQHALRNKLLSMGIVEGAAIQVQNIAPLGDPITVRILSSSVALRLAEASCIHVRSVNGN